jgi:alpha-L-fucosidase
MNNIPEHWQWFNEARFGLFIHWGPYAEIGRGEQVLLREQLDQREYSEMACRWNPQHYDAREWAAIAKDTGAKYAVLTTRHHDGYCLWDSQFTDYSSAQQAPGRDFVREYTEAFREAGLRIGLYYSQADFRIPAYWNGPRRDPEGWEAFRQYVHAQVRELLTKYGQIDMAWFDGTWPRNAKAWQSEKLIAMMRELQPHILINNRLDAIDPDEGAAEWQKGAVENAGESKSMGDFGTPEHHITAESNRMWESCQVTTKRLWGYTIGESYRPADVLLDMLCEAASKGGNLLLNVGPQSDGQFPTLVVNNLRKIGSWMDVHGEAIYSSHGGDVTEFVTRGWQIKRDNLLYLVIRFWDRRPIFVLRGLQTPVRAATLLTTGQELRFEQNNDALTIHGLPEEPPTELFPVIKLECDGAPKPLPQYVARLWCGDPTRYVPWAEQRGSSVYADGQPG